MIRRLSLIAIMLLATGTARAAQPVDLLLVLAVDASGSVSMDRFDLQKHGYAQAFANPRIIQAIRSGPFQAIAVAMVQWTGPRMQNDVVPWTIVDGTEASLQLSKRIAATPRTLFGGGTSISGAIDHSVKLMAASGIEATRQVIDISGDGASNNGRPVTAARDEALALGISINGLPILSLEPDLDDYYRNYVIGGPGAFVIAIDSYDKFASAILEKLITEIAGLEKSPASTQFAARE